MRKHMVALVVATGVAAAAVTGCSSQPTPDVQQHQQHARDRQPSAAPADTAPISKQRAGGVATGRYGGRVLNVEQDRTKGQPSWEVEVADSREGRIEVDVAQRGGAILGLEHD